MSDLAMPIDALTGAQLSSIAYDDSRAAIAHALAALPPANQGPWTLLWYGADDANQVYVARAATGTVAVAVRGSVFDPGELAFWIDWFREDGDAVFWTPWPWGGAPAGTSIASGTVDGIERILAMCDGGVGLVDYLVGLGSIGTLTVTGHSLGGGLAHVLAPLLATRVPSLRARVALLSYAAPAIGSETFAAWLESSFGAAAGRYHNSLDIVPHAWAGLGWIARSYPGGPVIPSILADAVDGVRDLLGARGMRYRQPGLDRTLVGTLTGGTSWLDEAAHQHALDTYIGLLQKPA
jgi:hypothetical protein